MTRRVLVGLLLALGLAACAPRGNVIEAGVSATLTALAPTAFLPADRATSTSVPTLSLPTATAASTEPSVDTPALSDTPAVSTDLSATPETTATLEAAATSEIGSATLGELLFDDQFDSPGLWSVGETDTSNVAISGGVMTYVQKTAGVFSFRIMGKQGDNFHAEISGALADRCASGDRYGLMFRVQDPSNYYLFQIDCDSRYRFVRYVADAATPLVDWTTSNDIERGAQAANTLSVTAQGGTFLLGVNGQPLTTAGDTTFAKGRFGVMVGSNTTKDFTVIFDNFKANKLP